MIEYSIFSDPRSPAPLPTLAAYVARCEARPAFREVLGEQMAEYALNTPAAA
jgi:glutathione S-transferase